ncbi:MAG: glycosyltransferase [Devosia sp.]|uniref:glycosyltransferase family 2 protein n=1 Tax=Devosia sp. TaxID=1871048 RepID=UPI001AC09972|nr:glycosyltransferase [Devosia sp.]MBN9317453.1 glycosyltransferase [Devosia sp.]
MIGVICKDGARFLPACLAALPSDATVILVDSASGDATPQIMLDYGRATGARVYRLDGEVNASVARNVILANAPPGHLLLLDGDIVLNQAFLAEAVDALDQNEAVAVCGRLLDRFHDAEGRDTGETHMRYGTRRAGPVRSAAGVIVLGSGLRESGIRYDETLDRNEDTDFSLRVSRLGTILFTTTVMGEHMTLRYYEGERGRQWFRDQHQRAIGRLVMRHLNLGDLLHIARLERGVVVGLLLELATIVALLLVALGWPIALAAIAVAWLLDMLQFLRRRNLQDYLRARILSPLFALKGLLDAGHKQPRYHVTLVE